MVFANIYSKLGELEKRLDQLSAGGVVSSEPVTIQANTEVFDNKFGEIDVKVSGLSSGLSDVKSSLEEVSAKSAQDLGVVLEKLNQVSTILAQFNQQLLDVSHKVETLEENVTELQNA